MPQQALWYTGPRPGGTWSPDGGTSWLSLVGAGHSLTVDDGASDSIMGIRQDQLDRAIALAKAYGATRLIVFGRAATAPDQARDLDLACDGVSGWSLYELGARLEEELEVSLDLVPLRPETRFTRLVEQQGKELL